MPPRLSDPEARSMGLIASLMVLVFLVMLSVFLYISRLARDGNPWTTDAAATTVAADATPTEDPTVGSSAVAALLPTPRQDSPLARYADARFGFRLDLPEHWRHAVAVDPAPIFPTADYDVVFEEATSHARLAVSVWENAPDDASTLWAALVAPGLQSVDGRWPTEAQVSGVPAAVLWADETPVVPARYAVCLVRDGRRYRVAYAASDGGARLSEYARAVVSFELGADDTPDTIPPLPRPGGRYFPTEALFETQ
jgi:hypothetical protein